MKKLFVTLTAIFIFGFVGSVRAQQPDIYLFYGEGCPHCGAVEEYFSENDLYSKYPIQKKEIYSNRENAILFTELLDELDYPRTGRGVPLVIVGDKVFLGDTPIIAGFESAADEYLANYEVNQNQDNEQSSEGKTQESKLDLTLAAVIAAAAVDAINPCAFAVLIILMSTVLSAGTGRKALQTGAAFAFSIFISYFLMGLGLYKALSFGNISHIFYEIIGWLAILLGIFNLKDFFWYGKGFLMEVPQSWRPNMKSLIKSVTSPAGAFAIGFAVSLFLLPCTSGPYIVILGMLSKSTTQMKAVLYLVLYNLIFVSPMFLISYAVYRGYDPSKAEEIRQKRLRLLHLIAGLIMIGMGVMIVNGWV